MVKSQGFDFPLLCAAAKRNFLLNVAKKTGVSGAFIKSEFLREKNYNISKDTKPKSSSYLK